MIVGASTCEVGVVYVGITPHLPIGLSGIVSTSSLVNPVCLIDRMGVCSTATTVIDVVVDICVYLFVS